MTTALVKSDAILAKVDKARALLAEAKDAKDAKKIADIARAAEVYAQRQKLSQEAIDYAHAIMVDAMTLAGDMLRAAAKATGGQPYKRKSTGSQSAPVGNGTTRLADAGISKRESSNWQALADIRKAAPRLHQQVRNGEITIPRARQEWKRVEDAKYNETLPPELRKSAAQAAKDSPAGKWGKAIYDLHVHMGSIDDIGGVKELTKEWSEEERAQLVRELRGMRDLIDQWLDAMEEE